MSTDPAVTLNELQRMKAAQEKIACLTAYDATFAHVLEAAGVDVVLVGDSLGMVVQGHDSTLPVRMRDMMYHGAAVARGCSHPLIVVDMPFQSYSNVDQALRNAGNLMRAGGAQVVKLEGGQALLDTVRAMSLRGIPVCAHLGLLPQSVHRLGGYRVQGRSQDDAALMLEDARDLQEAGAVMLVLECVPQSLATRISQALDIPVIGIGAGSGCDGQVMVLYDMLGLGPAQGPRFVKDFLAGNGSIDAAIAAYVSAVKKGAYPATEHTFS